LNNPILSPKTIETIEQQSPQLEGADGDTMRLVFTAAGDTYTYFIEKARWLIVRLDIVGVTLYNASYYYSDSAGIPALTMVAIANDVYLRSGGIRFRNVRVNGALSARRIPNRTRPPVFTVDTGREKVELVLGTSSGPGRELVIRDALGRPVFRGLVSESDHRYVWRPNGVASGAYMVEIRQDAARCAAAVARIK